MIQNQIILFLVILVYFTDFKNLLCFIPFSFAIYCAEKVADEFNFVSISYFVRKIRSLFQAKVIENCEKFDNFLHNKSKRQKSKKSKRPSRAKRTQKLKQVTNRKVNNNKQKDFCNFILSELSPSTIEEYFCDCLSCTSVKMNNKCAKNKCSKCSESKFVFK